MRKKDIEFTFYKLLRENLSISDFEKWVYSIDEKLIDRFFGEGFYYELIDLNYKNKYVINEVEKLLYNKITFGKFEEMNIRKVLESITEDEANLPEMTEKLYDLYCNGYSFLRYLGLAFIFNDTPKKNETYKFFDESRMKLKHEAQRIISFIDTRKIVITGEFEYEDLREEYEKIEIHSLEKMYQEPKKSIMKRIISKFNRTIR